MELLSSRENTAVRGMLCTTTAVYLNAAVLNLEYTRSDIRAAHHHTSKAVSHGSVLTADLENAMPFKSCACMDSPKLFAHCRLEGTSIPMSNHGS